MKITLCHINDIRQGDTVIHYGQVKTVSGTDITRSSAHSGIDIFGDSYRCGTRKVQKVEFPRPRQKEAHAEFFVVDENMLCYHMTGINDLGVLASSTIRGATHAPKDGTHPMPMDKSRMRPATQEDFDAFNVSSVGHLL